MLSGFQQSSENQNILEINHGITAFSEATASMFSLRNDGVGGLSLFENYLPTLARELYKVPKVKQLYEKRKDFDLIVVDHLFNEVSKGITVWLMILRVADDHDGLIPRSFFLRGFQHIGNFVFNYV